MALAMGCADLSVLPVLFDRIETIVNGADSPSSATAAYLLFLEVLSNLEVLNPAKQVFYAAAGADLFPFLYSEGGRVSDLRARREHIEAYFDTLRKNTLDRVAREVMPSRDVPLRNIVFEQADFTCSDDWFAVMQQGDVLFLKHAREYILATRKDVAWIDRMVEKIPPGAMVVSFEPKANPGEPLSDGLSSYLLGLGQFEDYCKAVLPYLLIEQLERINEAIFSIPRKLIRCLIEYPQSQRRGMPEIYFEGIGAMSVLRKL